MVGYLADSTKDSNRPEVRMARLPRLFLNERTVDGGVVGRELRIQVPAPWAKVYIVKIEIDSDAARQVENQNPFAPTTPAKALSRRTGERTKADVKPGRSVVHLAVSPDAKTGLLRSDPGTSAPPRIERVLTARRTDWQ